MKDISTIHKMALAGMYRVFDTETSLIEKDFSIYSRTPELVLGVIYEGDTDKWDVYYNASRMSGALTGGGKPSIIVGHNITFDLAVLGIDCYRYPNLFFWDTAVAHYEMCGQRYTFPSLNSVAKYYGLGEKEDAVSEMIKAGIQPKDIDAELLSNYCKQDVSLTREIFMHQVETLYNMHTKNHMRSWQHNRAKLILERLEFRTRTHDMSMQGMCVDVELLKKGKHELADLETVLFHDIKKFMSIKLCEMPEEYINPDSTQQLNKVLYGGEYTYLLNRPTGEFYKTGVKAGLPKMRMEKLLGFNTERVLGPMHDYSKYDTSEASLKSLLKEDLTREWEDFIKGVLTYRKVTKLKSTYYDSYLDKVVIKNTLLGHDTVGYINCEFKHVITPTGRISSTKPNIQNIKGD